MNLIIDTISESCSEIVESEGKKNYFIEGIFLQSNKKNKNGRVYPKSVLSREIDRYTTESINRKTSLGELNHPKSPEINPERASHLIVSLTESGDNWVGKARILSTPIGNIVKNLLDEGVQLGVSSRGLGTLSESNGAKIVNSDFRLNTIDIVSNPSAHDAWVNALMESKEWVWDNGILIEKDIEPFKEVIQKSKPDEELFLNLFEKFLNKLR